MCSNTEGVSSTPFFKKNCGLKQLSEGRRYSVLAGQPVLASPPGEVARLCRDGEGLATHYLLLTTSAKRQIHPKFQEIGIYIS